MTIYEFKKGDEIIRVEPSRHGFDRSYMGRKMTFIGILNGLIYLIDSDGDKKITANLDIFDNGWEYYVDPEKLFEGFETKIKVDGLTIEQQIQRAIENEDYELAAKLRNKLKK